MGALSAFLQGIATLIGGAFAKLFVFLVELAYHVVKWAWQYIWEGLETIFAAAVAQLLPYFPNLGSLNVFSQLLTGLEYANYWIPLYECLVAIFFCYTFAAVFAAFKFVLKAIPTVG